MTALCDAVSVLNTLTSRRVLLLLQAGANVNHQWQIRGTVLTPLAYLCWRYQWDALYQNWLQTMQIILWQPTVNINLGDPLLLLLQNYDHFMDPFAFHQEDQEEGVEPLPPEQLELAEQAYYDAVEMLIQHGANLFDRPDIVLAAERTDNDRVADLVKSVYIRQMLESSELALAVRRNVKRQYGVRVPARQQKSARQHGEAVQGVLADLKSLNQETIKQLLNMLYPNENLPYHRNAAISHELQVLYREVEQARVALVTRRHRLLGLFDLSICLASLLFYALAQKGLVVSAGKPMWILRMPVAMTAGIVLLIALYYSVLWRWPQRQCWTVLVAVTCTALTVVSGAIWLFCLRNGMLRARTSGKWVLVAWLLQLCSSVSFTWKCFLWRERA